MQGNWWRAAAAVAVVGLLACERPAPTDLEPDVSFKQGPPNPHVETAGNNLSFPVLWAEGVQKTVPGTPGMTPVLDGEWWYWWGTEGTDPNIVPLSCKPDADDPAFCDDENPVTVGPPPGAPWVRAYLQKDEDNTWQAYSEDVSATPIVVDSLDWGDNLESVDWYTKSQVRTEVVLFQVNDDAATAPWLEYGMRHVDGWGIDEVHGLAEDPVNGPEIGPGDRATVYTHCARLTIQKLAVDRDDPRLADLIWVPSEGWTEPVGYPDDLVGEHIFN
ncbi:MAG: hypothetical protein OEY20_07995, partial [Gemmatimonadota bacterium]|nr:hypothetical protein [Gemmatimonadota bacterium]